MAITPVDSIDDPRISPYRDLQGKKTPRHLFVVEGHWLAERLLASSLTTHSLLVDEERFAEFGAEVPGSIPVYQLPAGMISDVVGFKFHRGILACGERPASESLETLPMLNQERWICVACVGVSDPANLGGILRNCAAFGVQTVLLGPGCADYLSRKTLRVSMGTGFKLSVIESARLDQVLTKLREQYAADVTATVLDLSAEKLAEYQPGARSVLLFGAEGFGLESEWIAGCNRKLTIPMRLETDSLNVSVAAGIMLHHLTERQGDLP